MRITVVFSSQRSATSNIQVTLLARPTYQRSTHPPRKRSTGSASLRHHMAVEMGDHVMRTGRGWGPSKPRAVPWEWIRRKTRPHRNCSCSRTSRRCNTRGFGRGEHRRQRATCERLSKRDLNYAGSCSTAGGALPRCDIYLYNQEARYSHHTRQERLALRVYCSTISSAARGPCPGDSDLPQTCEEEGAATCRREPRRSHAVGNCRGTRYQGSNAAAAI